MNNAFYKELPDGFEIDLEIKSSDKKFIIYSNIAATIILIGAMVICLLFRINEIDNIEFLSNKSLLVWSVSFIIYIAYITLHELVHGIAYKILTKEKLVFGIKLPVAFCGVKNIYSSKKTALIAILAPFTVFTIIMIPILALVKDIMWYIGMSFVFAGHISGCCVDVYESIILLTRYNKKEVLMYDDGPNQTFYIKNDI